MLTEHPTVLLITEDTDVMARVHDLAEGVPVWTQPPDQVTTQPWNTARLVLVDASIALSLPPDQLPPRRDVVFLLADPDDIDDPALAAQAAMLGTHEVATLEDHDAWIRNRIQAAHRPASFTLAVIGGQGGIGASSLSAHLAAATANSGRPTILIDADPLGGGLQLHCPTPERCEITLLTQGEDGDLVLEPGLLATTIQDARMRAPAVVVDLPRHPDPAACVAAELADLTILLTGTTHLAAARQVLRWLEPPTDRLGILARYTGPLDQPLAELAATFGGRLLGELPPTEIGLPALCADLIERELPPVPQHA